MSEKSKKPRPDVGWATMHSLPDADREFIAEVERKVTFPVGAHAGWCLGVMLAVGLTVDEVIRYLKLNATCIAAALPEDFTPITPDKIPANPPHFGVCPAPPRMRPE